jgi:hypothetical protein
VTCLADMAWRKKKASRLSRLPLVLLLTGGLLVSLMHCTTCGDDAVFTKTDVTVAMNLDHDAAPDTPEQALPCHSGHCLSHITAQPLAPVTLPNVHALRAPLFFEAQSPTALAGLPLFKPPRA